MAALIVPLGLVRNAVLQSQRLGMDETRDEVIDRVLTDLRTTDHPTARAVREAFARRGCDDDHTHG